MLFIFFKPEKKPNHPPHTPQPFYSPFSRTTQVTVLMGILLSQQMPDAIKYITDDIFFFQEESALVHMNCAYELCLQHSPNAAVPSNSFLLNHVPNSSKYWLQDLGSHTAAWVRVLSQKDWRNQGATSWILVMHWYSIWVKDCDFCDSPFCQVVQKHKLFGDGIVKRSFDCLLYWQHFGQKISKCIHVFNSYSKPKVDVFLRHGVVN